jgi:16S rRNA processing protein RimM
MAGGRICVGTIAGVHGVRGLVKLQSFTEPPEGLARYPSLIDKNGRSYAVTLQSALKGQFLARIAGIDDRTKAEALKGTDLYVERSALPKIDSGYYHADLVGLRAVSEDGTVLGEVAAIHDFGAGDILEVKAATGAKDFMVPFVPAFVPKVDLESGLVVIAPFEEVE